MSSRKIEGVIFDADGTLLDSMDLWESTVYHMLEAFGVSPYDGLIKHLAPMSMYEGAAYIKDRYNISIPAEEFIARENKMVEDFYSNHVTLKKGAHELVSMLAERNIPMTVATATDKHLIEMALCHTCLRQYFMEVFSCSDIGKGKDSPAIYLRACSYMNTSPALAAVVDDSPTALNTARMAGFVTVGIYDKAHSYDKTQTVCDVWFPDRLDSETFAQKLLM